jgi:tetratricopeptide (TPR) repeat protein
MNRFRALPLLLALAAVVPGQVAAQKFKDSKYTKDADKFLALAMTRGDKDSRTQMYQQALAALTEGFEKDADNGKLWFVAGQAYVGLGRYTAADSAFDKATTISPEVAEQIEAEREAGWMQAFQDGVELMDQQQFDQALAVLEGGEVLYAKRPEGLLNIGSIYANKGEHEKAEHAFEMAAKAAQGDLLAKLDSASQEQWKRYVEMSTLNIAQIRGGRGVDEFSAGNFDAAADAFKSAAEVNPYSRDYLFNYVQAKYAKATKIEDEIEADASKLDGNKAELIQLYDLLQAEIPKVREYDPTNENLLAIQARAVRRDGELQGDTLTARKATLVILEQLDAIPVEVTDLTIAAETDAATISGKVRNKKLDPNAPVSLKITLIGYKGDVIGETSVTVNVGDKESETPFQATANIGAQVAGWKYQLTS